MSAEDILYDYVFEYHTLRIPISDILQAVPEEKKKENMPAVVIDNTTNNVWRYLPDAVRISFQTNVRNFFATSYLRTYNNIIIPESVLASGYEGVQKYLTTLLAPAAIILRVATRRATPRDDTVDVDVTIRTTESARVVANRSIRYEGTMVVPASIILDGEDALYDYIRDNWQSEDLSNDEDGAYWEPNWDSIEDIDTEDTDCGFDDSYSNLLDLAHDVLETPEDER
jgi:hypothetical protein